MKKSIMFSLVVVAAFVAGRLSHQLPVEAQGGEPPASCGDLNDDNIVDLTDAVYLLNRLFLDGPEPSCPPTTDGRGAGLPATGQTTCYDAGNNVVDCASDTCAGQDGIYQSGCSNDGRFVDNGDGTVTDTCTGLMWQKAPPGNDGNALIWCDALAYCEDLELAGYDDWRLPNVKELHSIVDYGRADPSLNPVFGASLQGITWSSTSYGGLPVHAWIVNFLAGGVGTQDKANDFPVRAVRSGP